MVWLIAAGVAIVVVESFLNVFQEDGIKGKVATLWRSLQMFRQAEDEEQGQRLLLQSGWAMLRFGLLLTAFLVLITTILFFFPWALSWNASQKSMYLLATTVFGTAWWLFVILRGAGLSQDKSEDKKIYSQLDRWLHWLALQPSVVRKLSFDLECLFALPKNLQRRADGAVYVCGLARSGTTMLLQFLSQSDTFRSLTYRDMPFVLAPNLWKRLNHGLQRKATLTERAHGDGILVDYDSPESFEEVFWRTFSDTAQRHGETYGSDQVSDDVLEIFATYRVLVAKPRTDPTPLDSAPTRYLSKNNNNLLRLRSLSTDPTATILLVYRGPVATARSLHRLHLRFCREAGDGFTQRYMGWLGHYEFGPGHLPFSFARPRMNPALHPDNPNYWLDYWNAVYLYILEQEDLRLRFVDHDAMCQFPQEALAAIFRVLEIEADTLAMAAQVRPPLSQIKPPTEFDPELVLTTKVTHARLTESKANLFRCPSKNLRRGPMVL